MPTDILRDGFEARTLQLTPDEEGPVLATLVQKSSPRPTRTAVLYLHGFVDYFFQTEMASQYLANGFHFYALDLRKYGRSLRPHQTPNYVHDLAAYFEEISAAIDIIRHEDGHERVVLSGHSTGGLIASLYAHRMREYMREQSSIDALVLNSPFFAFNEPWFSKRMLIPFVSALAPLRPKTRMPQGLSSLYVQSIHKHYQGEWDFNLDWKPLNGFPIYSGWLRAIHRAQRELRAGFAIPHPILVLSSGQSSRPAQWDDCLRRTDSVLNVEDIVRTAPKLGPRVTSIQIPGGLHDLVLSEQSVRARVYSELFQWLDRYLPR